MTLEPCTHGVDPQERCFDCDPLKTEEFANSSGYGVDPEANLEEMYAHLLTLEALRKDLLTLAEQYASDCKTRISILEEQLDNMEHNVDSDEYADLEAQIAHWKTTLTGVEETIKRAKNS